STGPSATDLSVVVGRQHLQLAVGTVEVVLVTGQGARAGVLPHRPGRGAGRRGRRGGAVLGDPERVGGGERRGVAGAGGPPVQRGVDHRVLVVLRLDLIGERPHPADYGRLGQPVALGPAGVVLDVQCRRQGVPVAGPATAVRGEVVGLRGAARVVGV